MQDVLAKSDIVASMLESTPHAALAVDGNALHDLAAWCRRAVRQGAWTAGVQSGDIPPWQRAFAHVVSVQDVLRAFAGRLRDGSPRAGELRQERVVNPATNPDGIAVDRVAYVEPKEAPTPKDTMRLVRGADAAGYAYDPSWVNGGIGAYMPNTNTEKLLGVKERAVMGIAAFASVEGCGGIPELAWFYGGADFELGMFSSFDGFVATCLHGGPDEGSTGTSPSGPGDLARLAAADHRRILGNLATLAHRHQSAIRVAYGDRRYPMRLVSDYGVGLAPLVWRAQHAAVEKEPGAGTLAALVASVRLDWPTYEGEAEGASEPLTARILRAAGLVLWTAHERYRIAAILPPGRTPPKRRKRVRQRPDLQAAGTKGRRSRQLVEVPRHTADEPRAA